MKNCSLNVVLMVEYPTGWRVRLPGTYDIIIPKGPGITLVGAPHASFQVLTLPQTRACQLGLIDGGAQ